jgi:hypothetical protein
MKTFFSLVTVTLAVLQVALFGLLTEARLGANRPDGRNTTIIPEFATTANTNNDNNMIAFSAEDLAVFSQFQAMKALHAKLNAARTLALTTTVRPQDPGVLKTTAVM